MKKHLFIALLLVAGLVGCDNPYYTKISSLERPIVVVAVDSVGILLRGSNGVYFVGQRDSHMGSALINSYQTGDTLK